MRAGAWRVFCYEVFVMFSALISSWVYCLDEVKDFSFWG